MGKSTCSTVFNQAKSEKITLSSDQNLKLEVSTDSVSLSSHGGLLLLKQEERQLGLASQLASCIEDRRDPLLIKHSVTELLMTRIFQICLGYEDINDCDRMRHDPMMRLAVETGEMDKELCSPATMCRFENSVTDEDLVRLQEMFVTMFVLSYHGRAPRHIILDCDDTNVDTYGCQEQSLFNGYYDNYCYMPLMVFEGHSGKMILPLLKPGRKNKAVSFEDTIQWLVTFLRQYWPDTVIMVRGDSHFCSHELMDWATENDPKVLFVTGLARNNLLKSHPVTRATIERVMNEYKTIQRPVRSFGEFYYKAGSWKYPRRVVVKAEYTQMGELNVRFIVSNIQGTPSRDLYEKTYCGRGQDELYIRELKEGVKGDRLSCHKYRANRFRLFLYAAAYILMHSLREHALRRTRMERASIRSIRERLLLCAVSIRRLKSKVCLDFAKHNPMGGELHYALCYYGELEAG